MNILHLIASSNFITVNKHLIKTLGLEEAVIIGELCSEYLYWKDNDKLEDNMFYCTSEKLEENTGISKYRQSKAIEHLEKLGVFSTKLQGLPRMRYITIHEDVLLKILTTSNIKTSQQVVKNFTTGSKNFNLNNNINIKTENKKLSISKEIDNSQKPDFLKNHSKQKSNKVEIQSIVNLYNAICTNLSKVRALTDKRQKAISNILKNYDFNTIKEVFENANNNSFLTGDNDRGWKADLDFILREDKFVKILENGYGSNKGKGYKKRNKDKFAEPEYLSCERYNPDEDEFGKELDASGKQRYF